MKKVVAICISFLLLFSSMTAMASTTDLGLNSNLIDNSDKHSIMQLYKDEDVTSLIKMIVEEENLIYDSSVKLEWKDLIKVYSGTDILSEKTSNKLQILNKLNNSDYCYVVSVFYDDLEIELTFSKGREVSEGIEEYLTAEQYQEVINNVGRWFVSSIALITDGCISYYNVVSEQNFKTMDEYIVIGGQPGFWYPIIIKFDGDKATEIVPIYDKSDYPLLQTELLLPLETNTYNFADILNIVGIGERGFVNQNEDFLLTNSGVDESTLYATSGSYRLINVTKYSQEMSNWCWAASAQMLGKYYTGTKTSQASIVQYVKGSSSSNTAAVDSETRLAISYAVGSSYLVTASGVKNYSTLENKIYNQEKPFAIRIRWASGGGHIFVVSGVNGAVADYLHLINPNANRANQWHSYTAMVNGTVFPYDTGYYAATFLVN